jgi:hypothetical protein
MWILVSDDKWELDIAVYIFHGFGILLRDKYDESDVTWVCFGIAVQSFAIVGSEFSPPSTGGWIGSIRI